MSGTSSHNYAAVVTEQVEAELVRRNVANENYIHKLEGILKDRGIDVPPDHPIFSVDHKLGTDNLMKEGTVEELEGLTETTKELLRANDIAIEFHDLKYTTEIPKERKIQTVSTILLSMLTFWKSVEKREIDILAGISGRILPRKMTLLIGPPGSGKSGMKTSRWPKFSVDLDSHMSCHCFCSAAEGFGRSLASIGQC